jgi:Uma2 family endonuclease
LCADSRDGIRPGDSAEELETKFDDYQKAGVSLIWVIYPRWRKAKVLRLDGRSTVLSEDDELSGEDVIPGFRCPLREILPRLEPIEEPGTAPNGAGPA